MVGECVSGVETVAGWEGKVLARALENWDGEESGNSRGRKEAPQNGRWWRTKANITVFAKCGPFYWLVLTQLWLDNNSTSLCDTSLCHSNDGSEFQAYDSTLLICFSIFVKI